jgi:hypothetical protein
MRGIPSVIRRRREFLFSSRGGTREKQIMFINITELKGLS